jgi:thioesterase domain-containing protein
VKVERIYPGYGSERLALHVNDDLRTGNLELHFDFSCDVFDEIQRPQTVEIFVQLIDNFLDDVARPIGQLDLFQAEWRTPSLASEEVIGPMQPASNPPRETRQREVVAPRDELEGQLIQIWKRVLGIHPIGARDNFFDLGGSSWLAVRLFAEIERVMGIPLPLRLLVQAATVEDLAEILRQQQEPPPWSPLVAVQPKGTKKPFFCVHGAGGHILLFDKVARLLGTDQPFFAFQARGIEEGQEPFTQIEDMAAFYVKALREAQPDGPYLLGGYSMGGMVAFEMAQQLQAQGQKVAMLAIIDVPAQNPHLKYLRRSVDHLGALLRMSSEQKVQLFLRLRHYVFRLRYFGRLKFSDRIGYVRGKLGLLRGNAGKTNTQRKDAPQANAAEEYEDTNADAKARQRIRKLFALNDQAFRAYIPRRYQGDLSVIRSTLGYTGDPDKDYSPDTYIGWGRVISGAIETYEVPGDHNEMIREPHVRVLAKHLQACLASAQTSSE